MVYCRFSTKRKTQLKIVNNDTFCGLPVTFAQCVIGTEKNPDAGMLIYYGDDDYSQGYNLILEAFKALRKNQILQPRISYHDF